MSRTGHAKGFIEAKTVIDHMQNTDVCMDLSLDEGRAFSKHVEMCPDYFSGRALAGSSLPAIFFGFGRALPARLGTDRGWCLFGSS